MFEKCIPSPTTISVQKSTATDVLAECGANSVGGIHRGDHFKGNIRLNNVLIIIDDRSSLPTVTFTERLINAFKNSSGDIVVEPFRYQLLSSSDHNVLSNNGSPSDDKRSREFNGKIVFSTGSYNIYLPPRPISPI